ncbi:MAG: leucine-rich repeat domain-containing protein, partial [Anaeroplasmataceae bacterium]|nr:leucine-rich repeat domain-containing protein [Anaeroplasmataceae bacterium]
EYYGNNGDTWASYIFGNEYTTGMKNVEGYYFPPKCKTVEITNDTYIGNGFRWCSMIETLILPETLTGMAEFCLRGCTGLIDLTIPFVGTAVGNSGLAGTFGSLFEHTTDSRYGYTHEGSTWWNYAGSTHQYFTEPALDKVNGIGAKLSELPELDPDSGVEIEENYDRSHSYDILVNPAKYGESYLADEASRYTVGSPAGPGTGVTLYVANFPTQLKKVTILKETIISVGAFMNFSSVETFVLPNTVKQIKPYAFFNCSNYKEFILPADVTEIGNYAYYNCDSFETIDLPAHLSTLGNFAFANNDGITQLTVPQSLTKIGSHSFADCKNLGTTGETPIVFESSYLGDYMFAGCSGITELSIPNNVTKLPEGTFMNCVGLKSLGFDGDFESVGDYAFYNCINLQSITLHNTKELGAFAFARCESLTTLELPATIEKVDTHAFAHCVQLQFVTLNNTVLGKYMFYKCKNLRGTNVPATGESSVLDFKDGTVVIPGWCFAYCYELEAVNFPDSLEIIEDYAFYQCNAKLKSITLPDGCEVLGEHAFQECTELKEVVLSRNLEILKSYAFYGCSNLERIILPQGLRVIQDYALASCYQITEIFVPSSVETIGYGAFWGLHQLEKLVLPFVGSARAVEKGQEALFGYVFGADTLDYVTAEGQWEKSEYVKDNLVQTNEDGTTTGSFIKLTQLGLLEVKPVVSLLAEGEESTEVTPTYEEGTVDFYLPISLKTVIIYDETIFGYGAFSNLDWLENFYYYSIDTTGYTRLDHFNYVEDLESTTVEKFLDYSFYNFDGILDSSFIRDDNGTPYFGFFGSETTIGNYAFANNDFVNYNTANGDTLSKVVITESFTEIDDHSFTNSPYILSAEFQNKTTGTYTFAFDNIEEVSFTNGGTDGVVISDGAFFNSKIASVLLNGSFVKEIGDYAFYNCDDFELNADGIQNHTSEHFLTNIETLGSYAFAYSDHVHSVTLPATLTTVGAHSFEHTSIIEVVIDGATVIGDYMFANNIDLTSLVVPASVEYVGTHAFAYCAALNYVEYYSSYIGDYMFYNNIHLDSVGVNVTDIMGANTFVFKGSSNQVLGGASQAALYNSYIYLGSDMRHVGKFAFALNTVVESIVIEEGLDYLGEYAFAYTAISELVVPDTSEYIGEGILAGCENMTTITIPFVGNHVGGTEAKNTLFGWIFGSYAFDEDLRGFYFESLLEGINDVSDVDVMDRADDQYQATDGVADDRIFIEIPYTALINTSVMECITEKCSDILSYDFYISNNIRTINVTRETVLGYGAFYNLYFVEEINLPNTKRVIEETGKDYETLQSINNYAFYNCYNLTYMEVPNTVGFILAGAFEGCLSLEKMDLPFVGGRANVHESADSVFGYIFGLREFVVEKADGTVLEAIPTTQYYMKQNNVNIDNYRVYYLPPNLTEVSIHVETTIAYGAFYNCATLQHINLSDTVVTIQDYAFYACMGLEEMIIPSKVTRLETYVFDNCHNITNISIPGAVKGDSFRTGVAYIGDYTFANCYSLENLVIPSSVEELGYSIFTGCITLKNLTIPFVGQKARKITDRFFTTTGDAKGDELHSGFGWLFGAEDPGWRTETKNGVTSTIVDPYTRIYLVEYFKDKELIINDEPVTLTSSSSEATFQAALRQFNEKHFLVAYQKTTGTYTNPSVEEERYVTAASPEELEADLIAKNEDREGFYVSKSVKNIILTNTDMILDESFKDCPYIETVDAMSCAKLAYIGNFAFGNSIQYVTENYEVVHQSQLRSFTMWTDYFYPDAPASAPSNDRLINPEVLVYVGHYAFFNNCNLEHFMMPNTVEEIGDYAFYCTETLHYAIIPARVQQNAIGKYAYSKSGLMDIQILNEQISEGEFFDCDYLEYIYVPECDYSIGIRAFEDCSCLLYIV